MEISSDCIIFLVVDERSFREYFMSCEDSLLSKFKETEYDLYLSVILFGACMKSKTHAELRCLFTLW
jgi:hypothetical protein